jgi:hypothetical protein
MVPKRSSTTLLVCATFRTSLQIQCEIIWYVVSVGTPQLVLNTRLPTRLAFEKAADTWAEIAMLFARLIVRDKCSETPCSSLKERFLGFMDAKRCFLSLQTIAVWKTNPVDLGSVWSEMSRKLFVVQNNQFVTLECLFTHVGV